MTGDIAMQNAIEIEIFGEDESRSEGTFRFAAVPSKGDEVRIGDDFCGHICEVIRIEHHPAYVTPEECENRAPTTRIFTRTI